MEKTLDWGTGSRIVVFGAGKSGEAVLNFLLKFGQPSGILVVDEKPWDAWSESVRTLIESHGIDSIASPDTLAFLTSATHIVISPGFPPHHPWLKSLPEHVDIRTEFELGYLLEPTRTWIGVTGTNGKTTTTTWLAHLLTYAGLDAVACGNVGYPVTRAVGDTPSDTLMVVELSSFQLHYARDFRPHLGILLNIHFDHLDWHTSEKEYIEDKFRLFQHQKFDDWAIVNCDEHHLHSYYKMLKARTLGFSHQHYVWPGAGYVKPWIHLYWERPNPVLFTQSFPHQEHFMISNIMAVLLAGLVFSVPLPLLRTWAFQTEKLPHRMEKIADIQGVTFINDSKATNVHAVRSALETLHKPIILIAGGLAKGQDFQELIPVLKKKVKHILLIGEAGPSLKQTWEKTHIPMTFARTLEEAVEQSFAIAERGDIVLLSPGCASFDMFENYKHRGDVFRRTVLKLLRIHKKTKKARYAV